MLFEERDWLSTIILGYMYIGIEEIFPESEREKRIVEEVCGGRKCVGSHQWVHMEKQQYRSM